MNYELSKIYSKIINEALGLGSYVYTIPTNPQQMVYDFYFISLVGNPDSLADAIFQRAWSYGSSSEENANGGFKGAYFNEEQTWELQRVTKETFDKIVGHLYKDLLDATYFSISCEFRHVLSNNKLDTILPAAQEINCEKQFVKWHKNFTYAQKLKSDQIVSSYVPEGDKLKALALRARVYKAAPTKKIYTDPVTGEETTQTAMKKAHEVFGDSQERIASYASAKNAFKGEDAKFIELATKFFYELKWPHSYGGPAWGAIGDAWKKLYNAKDFNDKMVWIDHIFDIEHNTGVMLNKVERYSYAGGHGWIKEALDFKRQVRHPLIQFWDKISPGMKNLSRSIRYGLTGIADDNPMFDKMMQGFVDVSITTNSGAAIDPKTGDIVKPTKAAPGAGVVKTEFWKPKFKYGNQIITLDGSKFYMHHLGTSTGWLYTYTSENDLGLGFDQFGVPQSIQYPGKKWSKPGHVPPEIQHSKHIDFNSSLIVMNYEMPSLVPSTTSSDEFDMHMGPEELKKALLHLKNGDKVINNSGIKGTVTPASTPGGFNITWETVGGNTVYYYSGNPIPPGMSNIAQKWTIVSVKHQSDEFDMHMGPEELKKALLHLKNGDKVINDSGIKGTVTPGKHPGGFNITWETVGGGTVYYYSPGNPIPPWLSNIAAQKWTIVSVKHQTEEITPSSEISKKLTKSNLHLNDQVKCVKGDIGTITRLWDNTFNVKYPINLNPPNSDYVNIYYRYENPRPPHMYNNKAREIIEVISHGPTLPPVSTTVVTSPEVSSSSVVNNTGVLTNILFKFHPKPVAHTGPAGKGGVKTLVFQTWNTPVGQGRSAYSGYMKIKTSHSSKGDILYYRKLELPYAKKLFIKIDGGGEFIGPTDDKSVVKDLYFNKVLCKNGTNQIVFQKGIISNAVLKKGITIDGNVVLINCKLYGCYITTAGLDSIKLIGCNVFTYSEVESLENFNLVPTMHAAKPIIGSNYTGSKYKNLEYNII